MKIEAPVKVALILAAAYLIGICIKLYVEPYQSMREEDIKRAGGYYSAGF